VSVTRPFIRVYENGLDPETCREIIARFYADPRKGAGRVEGIGSPKRSIDLGVSTLSGWQDLAPALNRAVVSSAMRYRDEHPTFRRLYRDIRHTGYQIQHYRPGGDDGFDWHADIVDLATSNRILAMILYLNTVEVGGETEFRDQGLAIRPREGSVVWFPPSFEYFHRGRTPVSGPKYIVTSFLLEPA
jgi:hypothetical protein